MHSSTLVSSLFRIDDNPIMQNRMMDYVEKAKYLYDLEHPIIIFTSSDLHDMLKKYDHEKVSYVILDKIMIKTFDNVPKIIEARKTSGAPHNKDPRNTPEYLAIVVAKFWFTKLATIMDPFRTSHFAWVDISYLAREKYDVNVVKNVINNLRDNFSCAALDIFKRDFVDNPHALYQFGAWSCFAAGFWSARKDIMNVISEKVLEIFDSNVDLGYGHTEQQIMYQAYVKMPSLFHLYPADYETILTNYFSNVNMKNVDRVIQMAIASGEVELARQFRSR